MKLFFKQFFFILLFLVISCGVKQPIDYTAVKSEGTIFVSSTPSGGAIILDHHATSKTTPDTLFNLPTGPHVVHVVLPEYTSSPDSHLVIVEQDKVHHVDFALDKISRVGDVHISSIPSGAEIYVNGQPTGRSTPDTLVLEPDDYSIELRKNGFISKQWHTRVTQDSLVELTTNLEIQQRILLEAFGNVSCVPCVEASHNLDLFRENTPDENFVMIEYFANWPSPNDPFNKVAPQDVMKRVMYYGLSTLPSLFVGGLTGVDAAYYSDIKDAFNTEFAQQNSSQAISLSKKLVDGQLLTQVDLYQFNEIAACDDLRLFVAIIENNIHFDAPPGSNGLTDFNVVFRGFLSTANGESIQPLEHQNINYKIAWPSFDYDNSQLVAFAQNISTKKIIQTTIN